MKRNYLILVMTIVSSVSIAQSGNIVNGGFENWTSQSLYESPTSWKSSNTEEYRGMPVTTKSTIAQDGLYSTKLETVEYNGDTLQGYVYHGTTGQNGPSGGIVYTSTFNTIRVQCQSDILAGDTLFMMMVRYTGGISVDMSIQTVAVGTNANWIQVDLPVNTMSQDELFVGFILGNPESGQAPNPGSWALVDNVELFNGATPVAALPNQSFETWATTSVEEPNDWYTLNSMLAGLQLENAIKTIDANTGAYAIEMTTISPFGTDTIPSFISLGVIDFNSNGSPFLPTPYVATPTTFSGAYKYSPVNGDQAGIQIYFMQGGGLIGSHFETFSSLQTSYATFSSPLTIAGTPDSVIFLASSGNNPGSVLKLDDLQFSGGNVGFSEFVSKEKFNMYPNPTTDFVTFTYETNSAFSYEIYNVIGELIGSKENIVKTIQLKTSDYPKGTYLIRIVSGTEIFTEKLIIE